MKSLLRATPGDKAGSIDGLNLFFGALLGANLGTMQALPLARYFQLILLLAGSVMVLRMISTSERRWYALGVAAFCILVFASMLFVPMLKVKGLPDADLYKLALTLAVWFACVLLVEFSPAQKEPSSDERTDVWP